MSTQKRIVKYSGIVSSAEYLHDYYVQNKETISARKAAQYAEKVSQDPDGVRAKRRFYHQRLKNEVLDGYGARCTCCGETNRGFLSVDHVNGGGTAHRKAVGGGIMLYVDIIRKGFPEDFQVLCFNCNLGRAYNLVNEGVCPHRETG